MFCVAFLLFICCSSLSSANRITTPASSPARVVEGATIKLVCVSNETMLWKVHGITVHHAEGHITMLTEDTVSPLPGAELVRSTLTITGIKLTDTGTYVCKDASDFLDQEVSQFDIKVVRSQKLRVVESPNGEKVKLAYYDQLNLTCIGELRSAPTWKRWGKTVNDSLTTAITSSQNNVENSHTVLLTTFNATRKSDDPEHKGGADGRYQCVDEAFYQSDSDSFFVTVGGGVAKMAASNALLFLSAAVVAASFRVLG